MRSLISFGLWVLLGYTSSEKTTTPVPIASFSGQVPGQEQQHGGCTVQRRFSCRICGVDVDNRRLLNIHVQMNHQGKHRKYQNQCLICGKALAGLSSLRSHLITHTGRKPFSCELCGREFVMQHHMQKHLKLHEDGARYFSCVTCGARFGAPSSLTKHIKCHETPFSCSICNSRFREEADWRAHIRIHDDGEVYSCEFCGKDIRNRVRLMIHMRGHSNIKPITCEVCGKAFKYNQWLEKHMDSHRGTENTESLPSHSRDHERSKMATSLLCQETHANQELGHGFDPESSSYRISFEQMTGASTNPSSICSCHRDSELGQCIFEQLLETHDSAVAPDGERVNDVVSRTSLCNQGGEMMQADDDCLAEELIEIQDWLQISTMSAVPSSLEMPNQSMRIAQEALSFSDCEAAENTEEVQQVIDEIIGLYRGTQRQNDESERFNRL